MAASDGVAYLYRNVSTMPPLELPHVGTLRPFIDGRPGVGYLYRNVTALMGFGFLAALLLTRRRR